MLLLFAKMGFAVVAYVCFVECGSVDKMEHRPRFVQSTIHARITADWDTITGLIYPM